MVDGKKKGTPREEVSMMWVCLQIFGSEHRDRGCRKMKLSSLYLREKM